MGIIKKVVLGCEDCELPSTLLRYTAFPPPDLLQTLDQIVVVVMSPPTQRVRQAFEIIALGQLSNAARFSFSQAHHSTRDSRPGTNRLLFEYILSYVSNEYCRRADIPSAEFAKSTNITHMITKQERDGCRTLVPF